MKGALEITWLNGAREGNMRENPTQFQGRDRSLYAMTRSKDPRIRMVDG